MTNVILTPDDPTYNAVWEADGAEQEHIVATGMVMYESENVSRLLQMFRICFYAVV